VRTGKQAWAKDIFPRIIVAAPTNQNEDVAGKIMKKATVMSSERYPRKKLEQADLVG